VKAAQFDIFVFHIIISMCFIPTKVKPASQGSSAAITCK